MTRRNGDTEDERAMPVRRRSIQVARSASPAWPLRFSVHPWRAVSSVASDYLGVRPIANRLAAPRTYMTPSESAGVAISSSPIELVAMCSKV